MKLTLGQFVDSLTQSGLLSADEVSSFQESLPREKRPEDAQALARELILAKRLTRYQAEMVYQGRSKGLVLGDYTVLSKIGAGGMGMVLKAQHRRMKRIVAVKVLPSAALKNEAAVKRFCREVEAAARLTHPNIVIAYDAGEHQGIHYLVMEYVDGHDLAHVVSDRGPLPVEVAIDYVLQAAHGLEYAHQQGIVHRDIKPSNLLVDREGKVRILDMGLARVYQTTGQGNDARSDRLTESGQVMGTCDYMAPEQAEDTHAADHRADVYSLGCTLYRLLTGEVPYRGDSLIQVLLAHREASVPSLRQKRADIPQALEHVFQKMLAKSPDDRYQSMAAVIAALESCRQAKKAPGTAAAAPSDSALTSFLDNLAQAGTGTRQQTRVAQDTIPSRVTEETDRRLWKKLIPATRQKLPLHLAIGGAAALLVILLGVVFMFRTPKGTLVVEVDQPGAEISMDDGRVTITVPDDKQPVIVTLREGEHTLAVSKGGFQTHTEQFTISSGGHETIRIRLARPPPAVRPTARPQQPGPRPTAPPAQVPVGEGQIRVLLLIGTDKFHMGTVPAIRDTLQQDKRFHVQTVTDPMFLTRAGLFFYDVLVLYTMQYDLGDRADEGRANLKRFVEEGRGLVLVHAACAAFDDWPEFRELAGKVMDRSLKDNIHDPRGKFTVNIVDHDHPVTLGMTDFETDDELYTCLVGQRPVNLLATAQSKAGRKTPIAFAFDHGRGRVFHCILGHDAKALSPKPVVELLRNGTAWAAQRAPIRETAQQQPAVPKRDALPLTGLRIVRLDELNLARGDDAYP